MNKDKKTKRIRDIQKKIQNSSANGESIRLLSDMAWLLEQLDKTVISAQKIIKKHEEEIAYLKKEMEYHNYPYE